MRMAPVPRRATNTVVSSRPTTNTSVGQPCKLPPTPNSTGTGPAAVRRTKPASTKPMSAMNRPMPTLMAVFSCAGMAWKTAVRKPVSTSRVMTTPSSTTSPMAFLPTHLRRDGEGDEGVEAKAGRDREGIAPDDPHEEGQHSGHQRGSRRDGRDTEDATVGICRRTDDERVEYDDVGHREERRDTAAHLALPRGAALGGRRRTGRGRRAAGAVRRVRGRCSSLLSRGTWRSFSGAGPQASERRRPSP